MTFEQIYKKYNRVVLNFIKMRVKDEMVAEELASDVMMKVHKNLDKFDETISKLQTWILNIAKNSVIDFQRKKTLNAVSLENVFVDWANGDEEAQVDHLYALKETDSNPEDQLIEAETRKRMYSKFESLSETEKLVASLHFFDGLSYDEVSEQLNMPLGTVKAKLHVARKTMMDAVPTEFRKLKIA